MAFNVDNCLERARRLLTEAQESVEFPLGNLRVLLPVAVWRYQQSRPDLFQTFKVETAPATIGAGESVDLKTILDNAKILPEAVRQSDIFITYAENPYQKTVYWVESYDRLTLGAAHDKFYVLAYMDGYKLFLKPPTGTLVGANITIKAFGLPSDVTTLPGGIEEAVAIELATIAPKQSKANTEGRMINSRKL